MIKQIYIMLVCKWKDIIWDQLHRDHTPSKRKTGNFKK